jgi:hypothetical protein
MVEIRNHTQLTLITLLLAVCPLLTPAFCSSQAIATFALS